MPLIRKAVRDAMKAVLSHPTKGFNARIAAVAGEYGIVPFVIDWLPRSRSFFFGYLDPETVDFSQLEREGVTLAIYTSEAANRHDEKPRTFSGEVLGHAVFYIVNKDGHEFDDVESLSDAIEDAVIQCFEDSTAAWPVTVTFTGRYYGAFGPVELTGDGWQRIVPLQFAFEVTG